MAFAFRGALFDLENQSTNEQNYVQTIASLPPAVDSERNFNQSLDSLPPPPEADFEINLDQTFESLPPPPEADSEIYPHELANFTPPHFRTLENEVGVAGSPDFPRFHNNSNASAQDFPTASLDITIFDNDVGEAGSPDFPRLHDHSNTSTPELPTATLDFPIFDDGGVEAGSPEDFSTFTDNIPTEVKKKTWTSSNNKGGEG